MSYIGIGSRLVHAVPDTTGRNPGNLTAQLAVADIASHISNFELYHLAITDIPSNTILKVALGLQLYTVAQLDQIGDWDPAQPMLLTPGQEVFFFFNIPSTSIVVPTVTAWLRYDTAIAYNT